MHVVAASSFRAMRARDQVAGCRGESDYCGGAQDQAMTFDPDDAIEMEQRHIREGEARIARQDAISKLLDSRGCPDAALLARELSNQFRHIVEFAHTRLVELGESTGRW